MQVGEVETVEVVFAVVLVEITVGGMVLKLIVNVEVNVAVVVLVVVNVVVTLLVVVLVTVEVLGKVCIPSTSTRNFNDSFFYLATIDFFLHKKKLIFNIEFKFRKF